MVAFSGGADSAFLLAAAVRALGAENVAAATAYSDSLPASERGPAQEFAESLGVEVLTPRTAEMEREGYRANDGDRCAFCKAELLDVLGTAGRGARVRRGRDRHQRRRRPRRLPTRHRRGRRPGRRHAAEGRRPHQGADPDGVPGVGPADVGQAGGGLPELAGRLRHRDHAGPSRPRRAGRGGAPGSPDARPATPVAQPARPRPRETRPGSRSTASWSRRRPSSTDVVREAGFEAVEVDPLGFRSGSMNERLEDPERYR